MEALKKATDKREIARLLQTSADVRQATYNDLSSEEIGRQFPHLKIPEMVRKNDNVSLQYIKSISDHRFNLFILSLAATRLLDTNKIKL